MRGSGAGRFDRGATAALCLLAALLVILGATGAQAEEAAGGWSDAFEENGKLNVVTTVAPISSIVRNVGGSRINLHGVVPDGVDSHTFEPAPSDAKLLAQADLVIVNGLSLEEPLVKLAEANLKNGAEILRLGDETITRDEWVFDFSFPEERGNPNPHLWLNVPYAMRYAELVADRLATLDPANADAYQANLARYLERLQELDEGIAASVQTIPEANRKLLTYHDSYAYFARRYGLDVIGAAQPADFAEPSPRDVARLIDQVEAEGVPAIFGSEVFPSPILEQIAREGGADYVAELRDDALPGEPGDPEHTYVGMMLANMALMIPALGGDVEALAGIAPDDTYER